MSKRPTNREVASAAEVSTGTVSNVLHRPHRVAGATRVRVERAMLELGFGRGAGSGTGSGWLRPAPRASIHVQEDQPRDCADQRPRSQESAHGWQDLPLLRTVIVLRGGAVVGSGLNECSMPDGSGVWVRFDDGRGRLLLTREEGYELRLAPVDRQRPEA